jgi:hypothetical protein
MFDLYSIDYLNSGSVRQQRAYEALRELDLLSRLAALGEGGLGEAPALVGSLPLDLALDESDIDFVAHAMDLRVFGNQLKSEFGNIDSFRSSRGIVLGIATLMTEFTFNGERFEIFTQSTLVPRQNAVIHLLVEERLLQLGGKKFRTQILSERQFGAKTEIAFGVVLGLEDPYRELLALEDLSDNELRLRFADKISD